ncbi:hypothetical protein [Amycolatopsis sp. lyj-23]|uniref:hypothetical protein n=1 Tax=Amycolatopsis sp. lyj-23 TaxID=2789283 RepID=UPI00397D2077
MTSDRRFEHIEQPAGPGNVLHSWLMRGASGTGVAELKASHWTYPGAGDEVEDDDMAFADGADASWLALHVGVHSTSPHSVGDLDAVVNQRSDLLDGSPVYTWYDQAPASVVLPRWLAAGKDDEIIRQFLDAFYGQHLPD